jgi:hypothetical protein
MFCVECEGCLIMFRKGGGQESRLLQYAGMPVVPRHICLKSELDQTPRGFIPAAVQTPPLGADSLTILTGETHGAAPVGALFCFSKPMGGDLLREELVLLQDLQQFWGGQQRLHQPRPHGPVHHTAPEVWVRWMLQLAMQKGEKNPPGLWLVGAQADRGHQRVIPPRVAMWDCAQTA